MSRKWKLLLDLLAEIVCNDQFDHNARKMYTELVKEVEETEKIRHQGPKKYTEEEKKARKEYFRKQYYEQMGWRYAKR